MTDESPAGESRRAHFSFRTTQRTNFGQGWISGVLSTGLGLAGLGAVLCFHFPSWLTLPALRGLYPVGYVRAALHVVLVAAFLLGVVSVCLRYNKALGAAGIALVLIAAVLGGSQVPLDGDLTEGPFLGLDWFLLNLIFYSAVYVPLERLFALHPEQPVFRRGWKTDLTYFFLNTLLIQATSLLTLKPAMIFFDWARSRAVADSISSLPFVVQVVLALLVADFTQYWVHRAFHAVPWLWRFHSVHHSAEALDWLAGSRLHLVDAVATRALTYVPIYVLGFSQRVLVVYVVVVVLQATFIHANVRWKMRPLKNWVATPAFHHWHHSAEPEAVDKNFAVHTPLWDMLFRTCYLPDRWPAAYGLSGPKNVPDGWARQFVYPFQGRTETAADPTAISPP